MARVVQFKIQALNSGNPAQAPGYVPLLVGRTFEDTRDIGQRIQLMLAKGLLHGTQPGYLAKAVGMFSPGCSVRLQWKDYLEFFTAINS